MADTKVLVVDDNPVNLELVTDLLEVAGYDVLQAATGEEGVELARTMLPELILMDIRLPGMDGLAATRLLKDDEATQGILIIALTAQAMKGDEERALAAGCDGYISKPIDTRGFGTTVADAIAAAREKAARP
jgi:CheY-like chemotaxis protein